MAGCDGTQTASELLGDVTPGDLLNGCVEVASVKAKVRTMPPSLLNGGVRFVIPVEECLELSGPGTAVLGGKFGGAIAGLKADSRLQSRWSGTDHSRWTTLNAMYHIQVKTSQPLLLVT